ncbi:MAG: VOC family protein [Ilumatobacter sp.]
MAHDDETPGRVTGIGGVFFRSPDPAATRAWYAQHLGLGIDEYGSNFRWRSHAEPGRTAFTQWSAFPNDTNYFGDERQEAMINYRVDDLDALLARLADAGVEIVGEMQSEPFGRFQHVIDGDGRRVELWEPVDAEYTKIVDGVTET